MLERFATGVASLIFAIASVASAQSAATKKDIPTIAKSAKRAIVTIVMANDDKPIALGTGFLVRPEGVIVTNYHVIARGNVAVVKFADGTVLPVDGVLATDKFSRSRYPQDSRENLPNANAGQLGPNPSRRRNCGDWQSRRLGTDSFERHLERNSKR